uniref:Secreted protein n=1 Tax=Pyxicephalus adspersus TaxID=30357 RepID=A0AAV2ZUF0_PYXAD|nr:TPA: hypothetical protein GDO54_004820 [Pyxicephalus adspersus]
MAPLLLCWRTVLKGIHACKCDTLTRGKRGRIGWVGHYLERLYLPVTVPGPHIFITNVYPSTEAQKHRSRGFNTLMDCDPFR